MLGRNPRPSRLLKKSLAAGGEQGVISLVEGQPDFERVVVGEFGQSRASHLVTVVEARPSEEDDGAGVFEVQARDRKSVGKGKRVSVGVGLCVSRLINKNKRCL